MKTQEKIKKNTTEIKNRAGVSQEFIQKLSKELLAIRKQKPAAS